jgi:peptide chain release factor subunit 1
MATELREVRREELEELGKAGAGGSVLSVFVRLDLPEVPTERTREEELASRLEEAEAKLRAELGEGADLDDLFGRVRAALDGVGFEDPGIHGVGAVCPADGEPRAYALRRRPSFDVACSLRDGPALEPLVEALPGPAWGVAAIDRHHGRLFRGGDLGLVEVDEVEDDVHRWHHQGGWSQSRYQRGIEKETHDHVKHVCDRLFALHERAPFDVVAVLAPAEIFSQVEPALHPYLRERLAGHLAVDVGEESAGQIHDRLGDLFAEERRARVEAALARLRQDRGTGLTAVGPEPVAKALAERRVEVLLLAEGSSEDPVEAAVEAALGQGAEVLVAAAEDLAELEGLAALLRY